MLGRIWVYLSSWRRLVRSRDQRQTLSQMSSARRTTQRASHVPSGFPHASHSFFDSSVGLLRCVEMVRSAMIAIICSPNQNVHPINPDIELNSQVNRMLTCEKSTTTELITDTSSLRALLFRPYPKKTRIRPAIVSLC